jgi:rubrerythrin
MRAATPVSDPVYGLVSVLYHALQGSQTYGKYIEDARSAGDDELAKFFEQCREEENERASRAQQLLVDRTEIEDSDDEEDEDDEE